MLLQRLKQYSPRSLYGRAALILIVPIVSLQVVVSISFIRRDLEDVTTQMTATVLRELRLLEQQAAGADGQVAYLTRIAPFLAPLQMGARFLDAGAPDPQNVLAWYEFSGRVVHDKLAEELPGFIAVQFPDNREVRMFLDTRLGRLEIRIDRRRLTPAAPHQLIVTMVFFGLLLALIAFVYLRNQLRPIKRLAEAAQAFGRGRMLPYSPRGATEVRAAGSAFVDMRARIERQIEQRTLMLSGVSHDLRTPLTRLKLGLAMLDDEDAEPLLRDVDEMQALLDAFLEFSRGASTGEPEAVDVFEMTEAIVEDWRRQGKDVMLGEMSGSGEIMLRRQSMRRAIENLVSNAVRYGTRARVSVTLTEKSLRVRVEDDGPGIDPQQRGEAVRPFTRLDASRNQNLGSGVGLGLAIVVDVARAHGGTLRLGESAELGGLRADIVIAR